MDSNTPKYPYPELLDVEEAFRQVPAEGFIYCYSALNNVREEYDAAQGMVAALDNIRTNLPDTLTAKAHTSTGVDGKEWFVWTQPTSIMNSYGSGDRVLYDGKPYVYTGWGTSDSPPPGGVWSEWNEPEPEPEPETTTPAEETPETPTETTTQEGDTTHAEA